MIKLKDRYGLYIGGEWKDASDGAAYKEYNPATGELLTECAQATREDVDAAVQAAWKAFPQWKKSTPMQTP